MDKNCKNCLFRERSYNEYPCEKCRNGNNWTPSDNLLEFAIEELEMMWEKIRALPDINPDYPMDKTIHISRHEVQEIVYERISELKGE